MISGNWPIPAAAAAGQWRFDHAFSPGRRITSRPTMAWRVVSIGRPATTPKAILAKRNTPFYASEISALQRGFQATPLERPCPPAGTSIRLCQRPSPAFASGPRPSASRQSGGSYRSSQARAGYCTTPVPQRRCMKRSQGANRVLSVTSPMMIITSMIPITWSMALSSRP